MKKKPVLPIKQSLALALSFTSLGLLALLVPPSEPRLTEQGSQLSVRLQNNDYVRWLTPRELLILRMRDEGPAGGVKTSPPQASLWSQATGTLSPLPGLGRTIARLGGFPLQYDPSPDGTRVVWYRDGGSGDMPAMGATAMVDGSNARTWVRRQSRQAGRYVQGDWLDSSHYLEIDDRLQGVQVRDLTDPQGDRVVRSSMSTGQAVLTAYANNRPIATEIYIGGRDQAGVSRNEVQIRTFNFADYYPRPLSKRPRTSRIVRFGADEECREAVPAPGNKTIVYRCHRVARSPVESWLHAIIPAARFPAHEYEVLWVSNWDGTGVRTLGVQPVAQHEELTDLQYVSDGTAVSFRYGETMYKVPLAKR